MIKLLYACNTAIKIKQKEMQYSVSKQAKAKLQASPGQPKIKQSKSQS